VSRGGQDEYGRGPVAHLMQQELGNAKQVIVVEGLNVMGMVLLHLLHSLRLQLVKVINKIIMMLVWLMAIIYQCLFYQEVYMVKVHVMPQVV
jgi:hypothetical protein